MRYVFCLFVYSDSYFVLGNGEGLGGGVVSVDTLQTRNLATRESVGRVAGNPPPGESFHRAAID